MISASTSSPDSLDLPLTSHEVSVADAMNLEALCRALESAAAGQAVNQIDVGAGVQSLLHIAQSPPTPAIPGASWSAIKLAEHDAHGSMLRLESLEGDGLSLHCDALGNPVVASWERIGTDTAATFYLKQGAAGWELIVDTGKASTRHDITLPANVTWGTTSVAATVIAGAVGAVVAATKSKPPPPLPTSAPSSSCPHCGQPMSDTAKFCAHCGKPRAARTCPKCNQPVSSTAKFCGSCGATLS